MNNFDEKAIIAQNAKIIDLLQNIATSRGSMGRTQLTKQDYADVLDARISEASFEEIANLVEGEPEPSTIAAVSFLTSSLNRRD